MRVLSLLVILGCSGSDLAPQPIAREISSDDPLNAPIDRLRAISRTPLGFKTQHGAVVAVIGKFPVAGATPVARALAFTADHAALYSRTGPPTLRVRRSGSRRVNGRTIDHVVLAQQVDGVDVYGAELSVMLDGAHVVAAGGFVLPTRPAIALSPTLPAVEAERAAQRLGARGPRNAVPRLAVVDGRVAGKAWRGERARLAWQLAYGNELWLIDANDGSLVRHDDGEREIDLYIYDQSDDDEQYWDSDDGGCLFASCPTAITSTVTNMTATYNYYQDRYNWTGYDGDDSDHEVYARATRSKYQSNIDEEFWIRTGYHNALDIFGHEYTHGVIEHRSDLYYEHESGALNESFADLMGNLVEGDSFPSAHLGEDGLGGDGSIRNTCDQSIKHYSQYLNLPVSDDDGGVHKNSGIPNNAWCRTSVILQAEGDLQFEARDKMSDVAFALMGSLPGNATIFVAASFAIVEFHQQFGALNGDPWGHACVAWRAWDYAGVTVNGPMQAQCWAAPDEDLDGIPDAEDNCVTKDNVGQDNLDGDNLGDVCDADRDGDGRANNLDNCPNVSNPYQDDFDDDGVGDVCEDSDGDGINDDPDNCPEEPNPGQSDVDDDGLGNVCEPDADGDGYIDDVDTCQFTPNSNQADTDGDGLGNACDPCAGVDTVIAYTAGIQNDYVNMPPQPILADSDGDGISDGCDTSPFGRYTVDGKQAKLRDVAPGRRVQIEGTVEAGAPLSIPLEVCPRGDCLRYEEQVPIFVAATGSTGLRYRVVDDRGRVVGRDTRTRAQLSFAPRGGRTYRLEVSGTTTQSIRVTLDVTGGE